jgi:hypothetical protein
MSLNLRYMRLADIRQVAAIDVICFEPPWSCESYSFEINESRVSHMVVLDQQTDQTLPLIRPRQSLRSRLRNRLLGDAQAIYSRGDILGYGGLWKIDGGGQEMLNVDRLGKHPAWYEAAASDHHHRLKPPDALYLREQVIHQLVYFLPTQEFSAPWLPRSSLFAHPTAGILYRADQSRSAMLFACVKRSR